MKTKRNTPKRAVHRERAGKSSRKRKGKGQGKGQGKGNTRCTCARVNVRRCKRTKVYTIKSVYRKRPGRRRRGIEYEIKVLDLPVSISQKCFTNV